MLGRLPLFGLVSVLVAWAAGAGCTAASPEAAGPVRSQATAAADAPAATAPAGADRIVNQPLRNPSAKERVALEAAFARADVNGDGRLSREEAVHLPAIEARFDALDTDHDGWLSFDEFMIGALAVD